MRDTGKRQSAIIAASLGAFFALVVPLQTYLGNRADYSFGPLRLVLEQLAVTVLLAAVAYVLLRLSERWVGGWLSPLLTGVLVCLYLETGPLSFGLPEIDGGLSPVLGSGSRKLVDSLVLGGVVLAFAVAFRPLRSWLHWVALGVLAMGLASLLDVRSGDAAPSEVDLGDGGGLAISSEIVSRVEYSPTRNVLLFVLDAMPATVACDIVRDDPALAAKFPGFVAYRENVCMHDCTKYGVPALMTGRYYEDGGSVPEYMMSVLSTNSLLQAYRDHGDAIYCILDVLSYGYTTARTGKPVRQQRGGWCPSVLVPANEVPFMCLMDVSLYRVIPFALKEKFLFQRLHSHKALGGACKDFVHEHVMYPTLASRPVSADPRQMFGKFHTFGSHMPYMFDCEGNSVPPTKDSQALYLAVSNSLVKLGRLMDAYREKGIYDKSFVVVTTDHGSPLAPHREGAHPRAFANMWVKSDGASCPLTFSDLPTSQAKVAPLLRRACEGPMTRQEIDDTLQTSDRLFRYINRRGGDVCLDWVFHKDGTFDRPRGEHATE